MKTIASYLLGGLVLLSAASCMHSEFKKTKSGLLYKIYSDGKGETAKPKQFLKANVTEKVRDSMLFSTEGAMPMYVPVDSPRPIYSPIEVFPLLRKGDSAVVIQLADTLARKMQGQLPPWLKKKDKILVTFKVLDVFASEDALNNDRNQEMAKQKDREVKEVETYLTKNNIHAQKQTQGTYVVVASEGAGPKADSGKQVSVRYTGKLIPSGKVFQSNMEDTAANSVYKFVIGTHTSIPGFDEGLRSFRKGGTGTLYLPAFLAYDAQRGPGGNQFENLIFDVKVVDVTDAPPPSPMQMPMLPQGQQQPAGGGARPAQAQPHR